MEGNILTHSLRRVMVDGPADGLEYLGFWSRFRPLGLTMFIRETKILYADFPKIDETELIHSHRSILCGFAPTRKCTREVGELFGVRLCHGS